MSPHKIFESPYREYATAFIVLVGLIIKYFTRTPGGELILIIVSVMGSVHVILRAIESIKERKINIDTFNVVALIASFGSGEIGSAAFIVLMLSSADLLEHHTRGRANHAIRRLLSMKPSTASLVRKGEIVEISSKDIGVGDVLLIRAGAVAPADGLIIEGRTHMNESHISGESKPVGKTVGGMVYALSVNMGNPIKIKATVPSHDTTAEKIAVLIKQASEHKSRNERLADKFAVIFLPVVIIIGVATYLITHNVKMAVAIFLVACADDMAVAIPLAVTAALGKGASRGVIIKGGEWLTALAKVDTVVLDKTGTLTYGSFEVRDVKLKEGMDERVFWRFVGSAEKYSEHPISVAMRERAKQVVDDIPEPVDYEVIHGKGVKATVEGHKVVLGSADLFGKDVRIPTGKDLGSTSYVSVDGAYVGRVTLGDSERREASDTIARLRKLGIKKIYMLTGDKEEVAEKISLKLGLDDYKAEVKPEDKLKKIEEWKKQGVVLMVGDGINDAPALALSDVGVAMGKGGTAVATEAADVVILTDNLERLPEAIDIGKETVRVVKTDMVIWLISNIVGFTLVLTGVAGPALAAFYNFATDFIPLGNSMRLFRRYKPSIGKS